MKNLLRNLNSNNDPTFSPRACVREGFIFATEVPTMVGKVNPISKSEQGQLIGLLADYLDHLLYECEELMNDEAPQSKIDKCNREIECIGEAMQIVKNNFAERLKHY